MNLKILYSPINELKSHQVFYIVYFLMVVALTVFFTWPVILNLSTSIYGYSGDSFGFIYYLWFWKSHVLNGTSLTFNPLMMAPFGTVIGPETGQLVFFWPAKILTLIFGEVASYNLNILISFIISALAAYLLFFEVSKNRLAAMVFSLVFAFSPYHFWKAYNHLDLATIQYIPLFLWSLIRVKKSPTLKNSLISGFALAILLLLNFYYGYFALLTLGLFFLFILVGSAAKKTVVSDVKYYAGAVLIGLILAIPFIYPTLSVSSKSILPESRVETYSRPLDNLLLLSARPWSYVLPSIDNPFFGSVSLNLYKSIEKLSNDFKTQMPFQNEVTIYLGMLSTTFFFFCVYLLFRGELKDSILPVLFFTIGGLFLISLPPFIIVKSVTIYLPTFFLHQIFPMFRSYGRLGIFILPLISSCAALGLAYCLNRLSRRNQAILLFACLTLFFLEFTNLPPARVTGFSKLPDAYAWLKNQKGDLSIMEYPKNFNLVEGEIFQREHGKKIANWYSTSPYYKIWTDVENIYDPGTYELLSALEVKYAVLHKSLIFDTPNPVDELWWARAYRDPIKYDDLPAEAFLVKSFPGEDIIEVQADPNLYRLATITPLSNGQKETKVINGLWNPKKPGKFFIFNLTGTELKADLIDGVNQKDLTLPLGKMVVNYAPGNYELRLNVLSL